MIFLVFIGALLVCSKTEFLGDVYCDQAPIIVQCHVSASSTSGVIGCGDHMKYLPHLKCPVQLMT